MNRRRLLQWGCAHCLSGVATPGLAQSDGAWNPPTRLARPDASSEEGGLWALMEREETRLKRSTFRIRDEGLTKYLTDVACALGGDHCPDIRIYLMRVPSFNASMAPNGMMQIWSGLLLRMENEAQLAAVIGHEIGHYLQRHSVERLRDVKARAAFGQVLGVFGLVGMLGQLATLASAYAFSREQEREADRIGMVLMRNADYDAREAAKVWANLVDEIKANPANDPAQTNVLLATHPPSEERRQALESFAAGHDGRTLEDAFRERIAPVRFGLLEDEVKRGRSAEALVLIERMLAREPAHPDLLYFRGEVRRQRNSGEDRALAVADFEHSIATGKAPVVSHRALGDLRRSFGQNEAARQAWETYLQRAPEAPDAALIKQSLENLK